MKNNYIYGSGGLGGVNIGIPVDTHSVGDDPIGLIEAQRTSST